MADGRVEAVPLHVGEEFDREFPGASASAAECSANLVRTSNRFLTEADRRRRTVTDLSATSCQVLAVLDGAGEPLAPGVIAERLLITTGTITSLIDTLERRDLVRRGPHPEDRRKILVAITDAGQQIVDRVLPRIHAASRDVYAALNESDRRHLVRLLGQVQRRLAELATQPVPPEIEVRVKATPGTDGASRRPGASATGPLR